LYKEFFQQILEEILEEISEEIFEEISEEILEEISELYKYFVIIKFDDLVYHIKICFCENIFLHEKFLFSKIFELKFFS